MIALSEMPWFGMDIGGTLTKMVYFEPNDQDEFSEDAVAEERQRVQYIHR